MKARTILILIVGLLAATSCVNRNQYKDLPEELAKLCIEIDKHPKRSENYYNRATYYYYNKEIDKGIADIQQAIKLQPDSSKYYVTLSDFYFAQRETDLTEEMLLKAIAVDKENNEARLKLAELLYYTRQYDACNKVIDEAVQLKPHNPKAHLIKAQVLKEMRDTVGYLRMLQLVIDQDPKETKAYLDLGYFYQMKNDPMAVSYYQNALRFDPDNVEIHFNLGKMYQDMDKIEEAEQEYKTAVSIDSTYIPSLINLGYLYLDQRLAKYSESVDLFTRAIQLKPNTAISTIAYCNRAVAYEYLKNYVAARKDYEEALKLTTNYEQAISGLNRIDAIQH